MCSSHVATTAVFVIASVYVDSLPQTTVHRLLGMIVRCRDLEGRNAR